MGLPGGAQLGAKRAKGQTLQQQQQQHLTVREQAVDSASNGTHTQGAYQLAHQTPVYT